MTVSNLGITAFRLQAQFPNHYATLPHHCHPGQEEVSHVLPLEAVPVLFVMAAHDIAKP